VPGRFVGRAHELGVLSRCLHDATKDAPRFVLVEGSGGSGKTALLETFVAAHDEVSLAWATGDEAGAGRPYGTLDELCSQLPPAAPRGDDVRRVVGPRTRSLRARCFFRGGGKAVGSSGVGDR